MGDPGDLFTFHRRSMTATDIARTRISPPGRTPTRSTPAVSTRRWAAGATRGWWWPALPAEQSWGMGTLHSILADLTGVCVLVLLVAWIAGAVYFGVLRKAGRSGWTRDLRRTLPRRVLPTACACVFSVLAGRAPHSFWHHFQHWQPELACLGALFVLASTALLLWSRWVLDTMWASIPMLQEYHQLRTDGPYRLVRHPLYTGLLGLITGGMLACGFGIWIVCLVVAVPWLLRRVRIEDGMKSSQLGASYEAYRGPSPGADPMDPPRPAPVPLRHQSLADVSVSRPPAHSEGHSRNVRPQLVDRTAWLCRRPAPRHRERSSPAATATSAWSRSSAL
ncbi:methyltransferase family protein [Streptomyces sioyaensis]|uniref:methyltransferase family protein n=1 Tax=Streptomyces sioyaensis TaxID=67364 RepID=UPI0037A7DF2A